MDSDSLGMPLKRLVRYHVLLMNVLLSPPQARAGNFRQRSYPTFVASVADPSRFRGHCRPGKRLVPLLLVMLRRLVEINRGLPHLCRVSAPNTRVIEMTKKIKKSREKNIFYILFFIDYYYQNIFYILFTNLAGIDRELKLN